MANRLRALKVDFVSMVPRPANQDATFVLAKHDPEPEPYWKTDFSTKERAALASSGKAEGDGSYPVRNMSDLHNAIQAFGRSSDKAKTKAHIIARAKALGATSMLPADWNVGKTDASKEIRTVTEPLVKAGMPTAATASNPDPDGDGDNDRTAAGDTDNSHFNADGTKKATKKSDAQVETISKAEYAKLEDRLATIQKALETSDARAQKAEAVAKAEQDARELTTAIAKAEKDLPALPGATSAEVGKLLRDISKAIPAESYAKLEEILKAANVAISKGDLFKEAGSSAAATTSGTTAMDQLQTVAKGLIDKTPELTPAASISKAMTLRPDLVKQDRVERGFAQA